MTIKKIYEVTVISSHNTATFTFTDYEDRDNFIEELDNLQSLNEVDFEYNEDEYFPNTFECAKKEVKEFLGLTD